MSIVKKASAHWEGDLKTGIGSISTETGVLREAPYGFKARFEGGKGTNPEELIGAAHAGCFSMALSMILGGENLKADSIDTTADVTLDQVDGGLCHHSCTPDPESQSAWRDSGAVRQADRHGQRRLPGFQSLERQDHSGCHTGELIQRRRTIR
jgi:OsmC subfamily peroxiredoxin